MLDDVFPEFFDPARAFTPADTEPPVDVESPLLAGSPAAAEVVPVDDSRVEVDASELADAESGDPPSVSAVEMPYPVATAATNHAATAMPPYPPTFAAVWAALRDGARVVGPLDESAAGMRLTG